MLQSYFIVFRASNILIGIGTETGGRGVENWRSVLWRWKIVSELTYMRPGTSVLLLNIYILTITIFLPVIVTVFTLVE